MKKQDIINYFDSHAHNWNEAHEDRIINMILDHGHIQEGKTVLDVACGTGILFPYYLERGVKKVIGVDFSPEMVRHAKEKCSSPKVEVICQDIEVFPLHGRGFDCIMIYNALPHFINQETIFEHLISGLKEGGRLTVAHGISREKLNIFHMKNAGKVSSKLVDAQTLASALDKWLDVDVILEDHEKYVVSGVLRKS